MKEVDREDMTPNLWWTVKMMEEFGVFELAMACESIQSSRTGCTGIEPVKCISEGQMTSKGSSFREQSSAKYDGEKRVSGVD
jgi:hypothetical protein